MPELAHRAVGSSLAGELRTSSRSGLGTKTTVPDTLLFSLLLAASGVEWLHVAKSDVTNESNANYRRKRGTAIGRSWLRLAAIDVRYRLV